MGNPQCLARRIRALSNMPERCQVVAISPLMRALTQEAVALPVRYELGGRSGSLMQLIQYEIGGLSELPLSLPLVLPQPLPLP